MAAEYVPPASDLPEPHRERSRALFRAHPEVRALVGPNPRSFLLVAALVAVQTVLAALLARAPWWAVLVAAYAVGAFANHALYVLIHECAHNLVFRSSRANVLVSLLADLPNVVPAAVSFRIYHLKHHAFQGDYDLDADVPSRWEARLVGNGRLRKAIWLFLFPVFQVLRPPRLREIRFADPWVFVNWATALAYGIAIWNLAGPKALLYLGASFFFSVGLHPLGARWIQEHYVVSGTQETYSYYGPLNRVALNVGYHNEHHDAPVVAWNRLPEVRRAAPELYESLVHHPSWSKLLVRFVLDPAISLRSRVERRNRGGVTA